MLGACEKTARVVEKVCNDHFDDLQGDSDSRRQACRRRFGRSVRGTQLPDFG